MTAAAPARVAVLGGSGFVGSAVLRALAAGGVSATPVPAPRLRSTATTAADLLAEAATGVAAEAAATLADRLAGADVVVNAAGDPDASSIDLPRLVGANALLPAVLRRAAAQAGARRLVHVSSAVVQGRRDPLDESQAREPFSPYSLSKCLGEEVLLGAAGAPPVVVYRPPSVHSACRRVTGRIAALASSPLRSVAGDGARPSPQALIDNVGAAVAQLCVAADPAPVVLHPWEGMTTGSLLRTLGGGRRPRRIPAPAAGLLLRAGWATVGRLPGRAADLRRIEMVWFGQGQVESWLTRQGWQPPVGPDGWRALADHVQKRKP